MSALNKYHSFSVYWKVRISHFTKAGFAAAAAPPPFMFMWGVATLTGSSKQALRMSHTIRFRILLAKRCVTTITRLWDCRYREGGIGKSNYCRRKALFIYWYMRFSFFLTFFFVAVAFAQKPVVERKLYSNLERMEFSAQIRHWRVFARSALIRSALCIYSNVFNSA